METIFDEADLKEKIAKTEREINEPSFWDNNSQAQKIFLELSKLKKLFDRISSILSHRLLSVAILLSPARQFSVDHSKKTFKFWQIFSTEVKSRTQSEPRIVFLVLSTPKSLLNGE